MRSVIITGFAPHTTHLCRLLNKYAMNVRANCYGDSRFDLAKAIMRATRADASIVVGGTWRNELLRSTFEARGCPAIVLWVGTDVTKIASAPTDLERLFCTRFVHWAVAPHLVEELETIGIKARYVPIAYARIPKVVAPMPANFTVLTYLPAPHREFYGQRYIWEAAAALPDVQFLTVGRGERERDAPQNVQYLGQVNDMDSRIDASSVLLRLTPHDGLSLGVIEALARGRHVVWTYPYPGVIHARSPNEAINALVKLREAHRAGALTTNETGLRHVALARNADDTASGIISALEDAITSTKKSRSRSDRKCALAISGQYIASARVAANCQEYSDDLSARALNTSGRVDTMVSILQLLSSEVWYTIGDPFMPRAFEIAASLSNKRRLFHWLGADVDALAREAPLLQKFKSPKFKHLAQNNAVAERLSQLGLPSQVVPLSAVRQVKAIRELPQVLTLLLYVPAGNPDAYGRHHYEQLMRALSYEPLHYIVVGGGPISVPSGVSVEQLGWRHDLGPTYDRSTALLRFDSHDSTSIMVIEALLHGRYVLCSNDFPFTTHVADYDTLERCVRDLLNRHSKRLLMPQAQAAKTMSALHSPTRCLRLLAEVCGCRGTTRPCVPAFESETKELL